MFSTVQSPRVLLTEREHASASRSGGIRMHHHARFVNYTFSFSCCVESHLGKACTYSYIIDKTIQSKREAFAVCSRGAMKAWMRRTGSLGANVRLSTRQYMPTQGEKLPRQSTCVGVLHYNGKSSRSPLNQSHKHPHNKHTPKRGQRYYGTASPSEK